MLVSESTPTPTAAPLLTLEIALAQRDAALDALASLVRYVQRVGGYMAPEDQHALWRAEAQLVAAGRAVER